MIGCELGLSPWSEDGEMGPLAISHALQLCLHMEEKADLEDASLLGKIGRDRRMGGAPACPCQEPDTKLRPGCVQASAAL